MCVLKKKTPGDGDAVFSNESWHELLRNKADGVLIDVGFSHCESYCHLKIIFKDIKNFENSIAICVYSRNLWRNPCIPGTKIKVLGLHSKHLRAEPAPCMEHSAVFYLHFAVYKHEMLFHLIFSFLQLYFIFSVIIIFFFNNYTFCFCCGINHC